MELPAGPAVVVQGVNVCEGMESERVHYAITSGDRAAAVVCEAPEAPGDRWLSIVETFEFLPEEGSAPTQSPSPDVAETLVRVDVPEAGVALELPESWTVEVEMEELSRVDVEEGQLITTSILIAYPPWRLPSCGSFMHEVAPATVPGPVSSVVWRGLLDEADPLFAAEDDVYTMERLDLPAGAAAKVMYEGSLQSGVPLDYVQYHIAGDDRALVFFCLTMPALVPDDDWLSIAESIELLPEEE